MSLHDKRSPHHTNSGRVDEVTLVWGQAAPGAEVPRRIPLKLRRNILRGALQLGAFLGDVGSLHASDRQPILVVESACPGLPERVRGQLSDQPVRVVGHEEVTLDGQLASTSGAAAPWRATCEARAETVRLILTRPDGGRSERELSLSLSGCGSDALEVLALAVRGELVAALGEPAPSPPPSPLPASPAPAPELDAGSAPSSPWALYVLVGARALRPLPGAWSAGAGITVSLLRGALGASLSGELFAPRSLTRDQASVRIVPGLLEARASYALAAWPTGALHGSGGLGVTVLGRHTRRTADGYAATEHGQLSLPHALAGLYLYQRVQRGLALGVGLGLRVPLAHPDFVVEDTAGTARLARTARLGPWLALDLGAVIPRSSAR